MSHPMKIISHNIGIKDVLIFLVWLDGVSNQKLRVAIIFTRLVTKIRLGYSIFKILAD